MVKVDSLLTARFIMAITILMNTTTKAKKAARFFQALALVAAVQAAREYQDAQRSAKTFSAPDADATDRVRASGRCCDKATHRACVCRVSVECPDHGTICIGSHE